MKNLLVGDGAASRNRAPVGKFGVAFATAFIGASSLMATSAFAQSTTTQLIEMMHANGSITDEQYNQLRAAARSESQQSSDSQQRSELAQTNAEQTDQGISTDLDGSFRQDVQDQFESMAWTQNIELVGDFRLRYEYNSNDNALDEALASMPADDTDNRSRGRLRYRLGIVAAPIDNLEVGAGLASGGDDPRSSNQTFDNNFSTKPINLDYAYAQYDFTPFLNGFQLAGIGGKFEMGQYLWHPTDVMWDSDINPEGASFHMAGESGIGTSFLNSGVWVIQENSGANQDPYMWYVQGGQHVEVNSFIASLAGTYYGFEETYTGPDESNDVVFSYGSGTNTTSQFSVVDVNGTIGSKFDGGNVVLVGQYLKNTHDRAGGQDMGWAVGTKANVDKWGMKYLYVDLDRNAVPDSYPDSDRFDGATGIRGHEVAVTYALNDAIELGVDYYNTEAKFGEPNDRQNVVQTDIEFEF